MILTEEQVFELIKANQNAPTWITKARERHGELKALIHGENFKELLIDRIEILESSTRAKARRKYSKDIRDMFARIFKKRANVFDANGGSESMLIKNKRVVDDFVKLSSNFKSNKSLFKYLSEYYFPLLDTDPNGMIFLEFKTQGEVKLYPTYKSTNDIRYYEPNGQLVEFVMFEPKEIPGTGFKLWRIVDDVRDWTIIDNGGVYVVSPEKTFDHTFGKVPAVILSDIEKIGTNERLSPITEIEEVAKDYARDKSILTLYKFLQGFPLHWRYVTPCRACQGTMKKDDEKCTSCDGKGYMNKGDVTDMVTLPVPKAADAKIAPDIAGYVSPDLETWRQYNDDLIMRENIMFDTIWGTEKTQEAKKEEKTATGEYLEVQPTTNTLNIYTDRVEYVYNTLANFILNFVDPIKKRDEILYSMTFGRRYILESPDVILEKYQKAKKSNDNNTILDKLLEEFILSKYKSDPRMQEVMLKKAKVEPYVHESLQTIHANYGAAEGLKKILFQEFWETANTDLTAEQLTELFTKFFTDESSKVLEVLNKAEGQRQNPPI